MDDTEEPPRNPNPFDDTDDEDEFFGPRRQVPERMSAELIVNQYLASPRFDTGLVKDFPIIEKIFRQYNTTMPSSADVERLFRHGGTIFNKSRQNLKDENFEKSLLLKMNRDYWM